VTFALLPVKAPASAKMRLAGVLTLAEREQLARLMYARTLGLLLRVSGLARVAVASSDSGVLEEAERAGAIVIVEAEQNGHSNSADRAALACMKRGARAVLMMPIDVPLARREEVEEVLRLGRALQAPGLVVVPSRDGAGTNVLLRMPPDIIESRFGPGSLAAHLEQAQARGLAVEVITPAGLTLDVDTPDDLRCYLGLRPEGPIADFLARVGARARLGS
jgi:2-phospho-L-lactate guanylyltransferase